MAESSDFSRSIIGASDETKTIYCDPCKKDGNLVSAEEFCVDCFEYFCKKCCESHRRFKALENHCLQDKDSMPDPAESQQGVIDVCVEKCSNHPSNVVVFFCGACDILGCSACITVNHCQCKKVVHILDIVKKPETSEEFTKFDHKLTTILTKSLNNQKKQIASTTTKNIQMKKLAKVELQKQKHELIKFVDYLEKKMDLEIEHIETNNNAVLKAASDRLESIEKEIKEMKTSMNIKKKNQQNCELFISMKKNEQRLETLQTEFKKLVDETSISEYTLFPSEQIGTMLRTITEICRMTTPPRLQAKIEICTRRDQNIPLALIGLTIVHGHYCVVIDSANCSIKVVDTQSECVTSEITYEAKCATGLTKVKKDCVAVSLIYSNYNCQIRFYSVSSSGVITYTAKPFNVKTACWGLEYCNDKLFLREEKQIYICNITGQEIKTIKLDTAGVGKAGGISLSPDGQTIYVSDMVKRTVTSLTMDGNVKAVYEIKGLRFWGTAVDKDGYVYIAAVNTILKLTSDLSRTQIITEYAHGADISFSSTENKMFLSGGAYIRVYDMMTNYNAATAD